MSRDVLAALLLTLVLALAGLELWRRGDAPVTRDPTAAEPAAPFDGAPEAATPPVPPPATAPEREGALPPLVLEPPGERAAGEEAAPELQASLPERIEYPLQEKYRGQRWSDVPHELIAAHDGLQPHEGEGPRRLFIALVEPGLPDAELERLVRDLRARHREAEALRVRVFDSREAATTPSWTDGGAARRAHLVADLYRDAGTERLLVRGVEVEP